MAIHIKQWPKNHDFMPTEYGTTWLPIHVDPNSSAGNMSTRYRFVVFSTDGNELISGVLYLSTEDAARVTHDACQLPSHVEHHEDGSATLLYIVISDTMYEPLPDEF